MIKCHHCPGYNSCNSVPCAYFNGNRSNPPIDEIIGTTIHAAVRIVHIRCIYKDFRLGIFYVFQIKYYHSWHCCNRPPKITKNKNESTRPMFKMNDVKMNTCKSSKIYFEQVQSFFTVIKGGDRWIKGGWFHVFSEDRPDILLSDDRRSGNNRCLED